MSILISGMAMPKSCLECPFKIDGDDGGICPYVGNYCADYESDRHKDCPLIPVPEHGDLIDRDALAEQLGITDMDCFKCAWGNHGFCGRGGDFNDACEAIEDAPTIIPADPTDKEAE